MAKKHGVFVYEEATALTVPRESSAGLQVVIGTAPVNVLDDPSSAVNVPVLANSSVEAMAALGYSKDFKNYSLCQTMYVTANLYQVSPVVYINVLDPKKHKKAMEAKEVNVASLQAVVQEALKSVICLRGMPISWMHWVVWIWDRKVLTLQRQLIRCHP